jgi:hypothetical protein
MGLLNNIFQKLGADTKILGKEVQPSFVPFHSEQNPIMRYSSVSNLNSPQATCTSLTNKSASLTISRS